MQILFGRSLIDTFETKHTICRFVGLTYNENHDSKIPSLLPSTENCQFQPCSPIKKFGLSLRKYDHIPKGLNSLGWLDIPYKLNFNNCEMMYKCPNILTTLQNTFLKKSFQIQNITAHDTART